MMIPNLMNTTYHTLFIAAKIARHLPVQQAIYLRQPLLRLLPPWMAQLVGWW